MFIFQFQYKENFWLLSGAVILLLLSLFILRWKKKVKKSIGDKKLVAVLVQQHSSIKFAVKLILIIIAFVAGVIAAVNPRIPGADNTVARKGIDVVVALDVSKSMLAADIAPNRLQRAKQFVTRLMTVMPEDRIAIVLFAGKAYLQMPLTTDHAAGNLFITAASPEAIPQQGTVISDALNMSANAFNAVDRKFKAVVLITDGEDHDKDAIETAKELGAKGMMINTVGVGSTEGAVLPGIVPGENKKDEAGNVIVSKLNESFLQELAQLTNGVYVKLQSGEEAVTAIKAQLAQIEKKAFNDTSSINYINYYWVFASLMFLLLIIETMVSEKYLVKSKPALA